MDALSIAVNYVATHISHKYTKEATIAFSVFPWYIGGSPKICTRTINYTTKTGMYGEVKPYPLESEV